MEIDARDVKALTRALSDAAVQVRRLAKAAEHTNEITIELVRAAREKEQTDGDVSQEADRD